MRFLRFYFSLGISFLVTFFVLLGWMMPTFAASAVNPQINSASAAQSTNMPERVCVETGQKIDLNNANLLAFTDCPGFYPTLAMMIVQNGPYDRVDDVLNIPNLNEQQQELLRVNLNFFSVSAPVIPLEMRMPPRTSR